MSYAIVRDKVSAGTLRLNGWWFDVASGSMCAYDRASRFVRSYRPADGRSLSRAPNHALKFKILAVSLKSRGRRLRFEAGLFKSLLTRYCENGIDKVINSPITCVLPLSLGVGRVMVRPGRPPLNFMFPGNGWFIAKYSPVTPKWRCGLMSHGSL
jgi:hypothetical protein